MESWTEMTKMDDAAMSARLRRCARTEKLGGRLGVLCTLAGLLLLIVSGNVLLAALLIAVGAALCVILVGGARRQRAQLIEAQLGGNFRAELEAAFGPAPETPELPVDEAFLRDSGLFAAAWETCACTYFREGVYRGLRFSSARVVLHQTVRERVNAHEGMTERQAKVFDGLVLRCRAARIAAQPVTLRCPDGQITGNSPNADAFRTPEFRAMCSALETATKCALSSAVWDGGTLAFALEAGAVSAPPAEDTAALRAWYRTAVQDTARMLDRMLECPLVSAPGAAE